MGRKRVKEKEKKRRSENVSLRRHQLTPARYIFLAASPCVFCTRHLIDKQTVRRFLIHTWQVYRLVQTVLALPRRLTLDTPSSTITPSAASSTFFLACVVGLQLEFIFGHSTCRQPTILSFTVAIRVSYTDIVYVTRYKLVFVQYDSNDSSIDNFVVGESSRPFPLSLGPVFTFRDRAVLVFYYLLEYTCTYDTSKCEFLSSTSLPFESDGTRTLEATAINNEIPGRQATSGQLEASTLSVRVFYQFASAVPRSLHLDFPLT